MEMSDKEFLESGEQEGACPTIIIVFLIAYLIMYSDHFMWALRRNPRPSIKTKSKSKGSKHSSDKGESTTKGVSQMDEVSQQTSAQKDAPRDVTIR
ncbi:unnamed protein product [Brugia timori]|uniref:Uncharacterized protein n=1 Tax=Brugia timori TaxID=42155 RepID=A0A0R3QKG4_9BILA|nr:unnamed protein product [Brugia timori]